jgi:hypothetical protein
MKSRRARQPLLLRPLPTGSASFVHLAWEPPEISSLKEVHRRSFAILQGEQLGDLDLSASARSPSHCLPHLVPEPSLLVSLSAAAGEEMLTRLGYHPASAAAPPALVIV